MVSYYPTLPACFRARDRVQTALSSQEWNNCITQRLWNKRESVMPWGMTFWLPSEYVISHQSLTGWQAGKMASWGLSDGVLPDCVVMRQGILWRETVWTITAYTCQQIYIEKLYEFCVMVMCMHWYVTFETSVSIQRLFKAAEKARAITIQRLWMVWHKQDV